MLGFWTSLLLLAVLPPRGEAQSCRPDLEGIATNLAAGRPACQSSLYPHEIVASASNAVDGNCSGQWYVHGSCTHTQLEKEPWWFVDLGHQYAIAAVVVKNREDCCGDRIRGAEVHVGDSLSSHGKSNPLCGIIKDTSPGSISTIRCNWLRGRYVSLHIPNREEYLHVCEVEVYGTNLEDQC